MGFGCERLSCGQARERDMIFYLSTIGYEAVKVRGNDYWYLSPLCQEKTASFKVNRKLNRWYDHGRGIGGNLIDFGIRYHQCTVSEFLGILAGGFHITQPSDLPKPAIILKEQVSPIEIISENPLHTVSLLKLIRERGISQSIAEKYCTEVNFRLNGKNHFAIGFKNDQGGFELKNKYSKLSSSPKTITTIKTDSAILLVFEGFFDFLSFLVLHEQEDNSQYDFLILNSISFFMPAIQIMLNYSQVKLYLDNDLAGQNCSRYAQGLDKRFINESMVYSGYKDLNDYLNGEK